MPDLSAIICTYDRYNVLPLAIASLLAQNIGAGDMEIIVVDNSPDQAAAAAFGARYAGLAQLRYVLEPAPGLSNARNRGAALAAGEIAAFIDDDAVASPLWAAAMLQAFSAYGGRAGAVGGPIAPRWLAPRPDWLHEELLGYLAILDVGPQRHEMTHALGIFGCNMAMDKNLLLQQGGFSPALGRKGAGLTLLSNEEPELFTKMAACGRALIYEPKAQVEHLIDPARLNQRWFRRRVAWQAVSDYIMNPAKAAVEAQAAETYLRQIAAERRQAMFFDTADTADGFLESCALMRRLVVATLHGGAAAWP